MFELQDLGEASALVHAIVPPHPAVCLAAARAALRYAGDRQA